MYWTDFLKPNFQYRYI